MQGLADRCDLCLLQDVTPVATERCGALVNGTRRAELGCGVALAGMVREPAVEPSLEAASIGLAGEPGDLGDREAVALRRVLAPLGAILILACCPKS